MGRLPATGPFEAPDYVVKPFKQNLPSAQELGFPPARAYQPYAAGEVIASWPSGLARIWGVAVDLATDNIWVSSPSPAWGGNNTLNEYTPGGTPTGKSYPFSWNPASGPADLAYNVHTGMLWVVNTFIDNCIYEIDPNSGYTGRKICPGGGSGFSIPQRGLAYDPATDTFYSGGWNDKIVNQFNADGTILRSINVNLAISGLAYNPNTQHLFVMTNGSPTSVSALDAAHNLVSLGSFTVAGMGAFAGAGLEMGCNGSLWAADQNTGAIFNLQSGEATTFCNMDVPWLNEAPASGSLSPAGSQPVVVTFDAANLLQPGTYQAQLKVMQDTPYSVPALPVSLHVILPASWGTLNGTIAGLGLCDTGPSQPLANAPVEIWSVAQPPVLLKTLTTSAAGQYSWPLAAGSYTLKAYENGYVAQSQPVTLAAGQTLTTDLELRLDAPCFSAAPTSLSASLNPGQTQTLPLTLNNTGAAEGQFTIVEQNGTPPLAVQQAAPQGLLFQENFESGQFPPLNWSLHPADGSYSWKVSGNAHTGIRGGEVLYDPALQSQDEWLLSPPMDLSKGMLSFWSSGSLYWCRDVYDNCDLKVWIVVGDVGGADDIYVGKADDNWTAEWAWSQSIFDLTRLLPGGAVRIGFEYTGSNGAQISLDDIQLDGIQVTDVPWVSETPTSGSVPLESSQPVDVTFDATGMLAGTYHAFLNVSSPTTTALNVPLTLTVLPQYGVEVNPVADAKSGDPGTVIEYSLVVKNTGNISDTFIPEIDSPWPVTLDAPSPLTLGPGASAPLKAMVIIPGAALAGAVNVSTVRFISQNDPGTDKASASVILTTTANTVHAAELTATAAAQSGLVGGTVQYSLTVKNTGNTTDDFTLSLGSPSPAWQTDIEPLVITGLGVGETRTVTVTVFIPLSAERGSTDLARVTAAPTGFDLKAVAVTLTTTAGYHQIWLPAITR